MKKYGSRLLAAVLTLLCLSGCGGTSADGTQAPASDGGAQGKPLQIVTTIFPAYDWTREILGTHAGRAALSLLLDNGVDMHSYQPSAADILALSDCDLFIYVGGESDEWVEDALAETENPDRQVICLLTVLGDGAKEEAFEEGMAAGETTGAAPEYDEHVWLSLRSAAVLCDAIADALADLDPDNAGDYRDNAAAYREKLAGLDAAYVTAVNAAPRKTLLFCDRFPFRYLADDYGIAYYAAFAGCSAETEASFATIVFLAGKVDELGLHSVLTLEKSDQKLARTVVQNTQSGDQQIWTLDSMQSVTARDIDGGATYLSIMEDNLDALQGAMQ